MPTVKVLRKRYIPLIKKEYDEKLKEYLKDRKLIVLCNETTNKKGEAAFIILFKVLPSKENVEPVIVVGGVKILQATNGDETAKTILKVNYLTKYTI